MSADAAVKKLAVLVTGGSEAQVRTFLARYVRPAFGLVKNQWRRRYREQYGLAVLARPLRRGEDPQAVYGAHADCAVLVLGALRGDVPTSGRAEQLAWLKARGFAPVVEQDVLVGVPECDSIDQGAEVVNFVNLHCPWRDEPIEDLEAYVAKNAMPFWA